jgi:hypothetical protein
MIWLQTATVLCLGEVTISQLLSSHGVNDVRQPEKHTAEPLITEPSVLEFYVAVDKPKNTNRQVLIKSQQN